MAEPEINAFLTCLALNEKVSTSARDPAHSALPLNCLHGIGRKVDGFFKAISDRKSKHLPIVMMLDEIRAVLSNRASEN